MTSMAVCPERRPAGQRVIGDGPQAIDVGRAVGRLVVHDLLGSHVQRRAGDRPFVGEMDRIVFAEVFTRPKSSSLVTS